MVSCIMHVLITNHALHHNVPGHPGLPPQMMRYDTHILHQGIHDYVLLSHSCQLDLLSHNCPLIHSCQLDLLSHSYPMD